MNKMINEIKEINLVSLCIYKVGTFYHAYGKDAVILSFLFSYKIKELSQNHKECGFPIGAVNKVTAKLQNSQLNYLLMFKGTRSKNMEIVIHVLGTCPFKHALLCDF